jgi:hypothetical protein
MRGTCWAVGCWVRVQCSMENAYDEPMVRPIDSGPAFRVRSPEHRIRWCYAIGGRTQRSAPSGRDGNAIAARNGRASCRCSKIRFGLRNGWQAKNTTDDMMIFHQLKRMSATGCESSSLPGFWVPMYSSAAIVKRNDHAETGVRFGHPQQFTLRDVRSDGADHPPVGRR